MGHYTATQTDVEHVTNTNLVQLRVVEGPGGLTGPDAVLGSCIGDPNGAIIGWRGDVRFDIETPALWQKQDADLDGTAFGWTPIGASDFGPALAALQVQVTALEADVAALQAAVLQNTADISTLQSEPYVTIGNSPTLSGERALTSSPTVAFQDNGPNSTVVASVPANAITNTELADMPALSVKANPTGLLADPQDVAAAADNTFFGRQAGALGFFAVAGAALPQSFVTVSAEATLANERVATTSTTISVVDNGPGTTVVFNIVVNSVDNTLLADMPANTIKANPTAGVADPQDMSVGTNTVVGRVAGNIVAAQLVTGQIGNDQVDNTKLANMAAQSFKANPTGASADPQDVTVGTNEVVSRAGGNLGSIALGTNTILSRAGADLIALVVGANEIPLRAGGNLTTLAVGANTVVGRQGADIVAAQVATGQIANNAVTNAKLAQMAARTVKVNSTNALADPSDLAGGGAGTFLTDTGTALEFTSINLVQNVDTIVANFNFSGMANLNLTTGVHSLTSEEGVAMNFTSNQQGTTFDILNGTGIRFRADATSTQYTNATTTAAALLFTWGDFYTAFGVDPSRHYFVVMYNSTITIPNAQTSPAGVLLGIMRPVNTPGTAIRDWKALQRSNAAGAITIRTVAAATSDGDNYANPIGVANTKVLGMRFGSDLECMVGDWDTGTQTFDQVRFPRYVAGIVGTSVAGAVWRDQGGEVTMAYATGNTNANMSVDTARLVIYAR